MFFPPALDDFYHLNDLGRSPLVQASAVCPRQPRVEPLDNEATWKIGPGNMVRFGTTLMRFPTFFKSWMSWAIHVNGPSSSLPIRWKELVFL